MTTTGSAVDLHNLSSEQEDVLEFLFAEFTPHQVLQLVAMVRHVRKHLGFGSIRIRIHQGHPTEIEEAETAKLLPSLPGPKVRELLQHTAPLNPDHLQHPPMEP